ncbi:hypothetical protein AB0I94_02185 [Streptomyces sp. NPDC050147]|uniref:hypothetical protein n=1 Tax=Streptomyces sp. NPDC050147 TaxID=3155513 RepID=UPI0034308842
MIGRESPAEIAACVSVAVGVFAGSLVPFFLLVEAEHLTPRWARESDVPTRVGLAVANAWDRARLAVIEGLLFLLRLAAPKGAAR